MSNLQICLLAISIVIATAGCTAQTPPPAVSVADSSLASAAAASPSPSSASPSNAVIVDGGARAGAQGITVPDAEGKMVSYVVADGDSAGIIAARFGLSSLGQITNEDGQGVGDNIAIFAGETLTLRPN